MSLWDTLKPAKKEPVATSISLSDDRQELTLVWSDGVTTHATARLLRQRCPCAGCVDEWTGARTLEVEKVSPDEKLTDVATVGNYALTFTFVDGHHTGIYHWTYLREITGASGARVPTP